MQPKGICIITKWNKRILTAFFINGRPVQLQLEPAAGRFVLNNIYIGKVQKIVKNIHAAFVDIGEGQTGYFSLSNDPQVIRLSGLNTNSKASERLVQGDEILVQISKEAVKTKAPVLTSNLSFPGRYLVLTWGKTEIGFSGKIRDKAWKDELRSVLEAHRNPSYGLIVRTNAREADTEAILAEMKQLEQQYHSVLGSAPYRTCYSILYQSPPSYVSGLRDAYAAQMDQIITDEPEIYQVLKQYLTEQQPEDLEKLCFYEDPLVSLSNLHRLNHVMEKALEKQIWLKSGGYLVIEPTEALTVIDVNTGKYSGKKNMRSTIRLINLEAAEEIGHQLRLRNLSGIIVVDFIDMEEESDREELMNCLRQIVSQDPVRTTVVDMTALNLVELTRMKVKKPLHEQVSGR